MSYLRLVSVKLPVTGSQQPIARPEYIPLTALDEIIAVPVAVPLHGAANASVNLVRSPLIVPCTVPRTGIAALKLHTD